MKYSFLCESNIISTWAKDVFAGTTFLFILSTIVTLCKRTNDPKIRRVNIIHDLESKHSLNEKLIEAIDDEKKIEKLKNQNLQIQLVLSKIYNMSDKELKNWSTKQDIIKGLKRSIMRGIVGATAKTFKREAIKIFKQELSKQPQK